MADAGLIFGFFVNGLVFGSILALGAIGLTLVYGLLRIANFAHGDLLSLGAFLTFVFAVRLEPDLPLVAAGASMAALGTALVDRFFTGRLSPGERRILEAFGVAALVPALAILVEGPTPQATTLLELAAAAFVAIAAVALVTVGAEFAMWRPLRRRGATPLTLIIVSIGLALVLRNSLLLEFGGGLHRLLRPTLTAPVFLGAHVSYAQQFALGSSLVLMLLLHAFLKYTRTGKAMRALSDDMDLARLCGIDVDRIILYVWILAGALIAYAGVLLTLFHTNSMFVSMGFSLLIPLFAAAILGGIGSPYGAILGAFVVGIAMKTSILWWGSEYETASAFLILAGVMLLRPQGLMGGKIR